MVANVRVSTEIQTMPLTFLRRIGRLFGSRLLRVAPVKAYDRWAATYDSQPDNVVLALESSLFTELLARVDIEGKIVLDIGCGTGRHWPDILLRMPAELIGVDPSARMLERLKAHYPDARLMCAEGDHLPEIADASCDVIISTLVLAHIRSAAVAIREWHRILRPGGAVLVTDFHPAAKRAGMKRTFDSEGQTIEIEHYPTEMEQLRHLVINCGFTAACVTERAIDESVRPLFERARYLKAYKKHKGQPLVFGIHLMKP